MSWDDERDDRAEGEQEGELPADGAAEHEIPPPSTYAGRRRSEPEEDDDFEVVDRSVEAELDELEDLDEDLDADEEFDDELDADDEFAADEEDELDELDEDDYEDDGEHELAEESEDSEEQPTQAYAIGEAPDDDAVAAEADAESQDEEEAGAAEEPDAAEEEATGAEEADAEAEEAGEADEDGDEPPSREQSTDAALAGLRARAAGKPEQPAGAAPAEPTPAVAAAAAEDEDDGKTPRAKPVWARFLAASLVIVASVAAATSISLLLFLTDIAAGLGGIPDIEGELTDIDPGGPQTILILGSDARPTDETARSDTAILLRVDPDKKAIALLSIPRDLKVNIPGRGEDKFNAAYSYGQAKLTLKTVTNLTGLDINHVVNVDFTGFADAVNAIDCVYIDVDRHYFIPPESGISEIDIQAGYQRLCGLKALQYVRYRHTDNDLVRAARQQDFIREARQNLPPSKLISDRDELLDIFAEYTTSDNALKDPVAVLELLRTFYEVRNVPVREVHFPAELGEVYVSAGDEAIQQAIDEFLATGGTPGPTPPGEGDGDGGGGGGGDGGGDKDRDKEQEEPKPPEGPPMTDASGAIVPYAQKIAATKTKDGESMVPFDIYYPTLVPPDAQVTPTVMEASRAFPIDGPGDDAYRGYKFVMGLPGAAGFTEYWGVSGTNWVDPPILENPSETRAIDGREYMLYYDGDRLRLVGWKSKNAAYWVNNTLLQTLEEGEMLSSATHMRELNV